MEDVIACAQSLQSCPTLCDPMDYSLPDSSVHGDSPGKNTGVSCHALNQGIFLTQGLNLSLLRLPHCSRSLYPLSWKARKIHSVQFSCSVMSDSLWPHGLQHNRFPFPSPSPEVCSNSCPLRQWYHPTISSSVIPFSSCLQSFPASGSFLMSWFFTSGGQSIGASASVSVFPMNIQDRFPLGLTCLISLQSKGLSRDFSNTTVQKHQFFSLNLLYGPTLTSIHDCWENHSFD